MFADIGEIFQDKTELFDRFQDKHGKGRVINDLIEESAEMIAAVQHFRRGKITEQELASELADVLILINGITRCGFVKEDLILERIQFKLDRTERELDD